MPNDMKIPPRKKKPMRLYVDLTRLTNTGEVVSICIRLGTQLGDVYELRLIDKSTGKPEAEAHEWICISEMSPPRAGSVSWETARFIRNDKQAAYNIIKDIVLEEPSDIEGEETIFVARPIELVRDLEFSWIIAALPDLKTPNYSFELLLNKRFFSKDDIDLILKRDRIIIYGVTRFSKYGNLQVVVYSIYDILGDQNAEKEQK